MAPTTKKKIRRRVSEPTSVPAPPDRMTGVKRLDHPEQKEPVDRLRLGDHRAVFVVRSTEVRVLRVFHRAYGHGRLDRMDLDRPSSHSNGVRLLPSCMTQQTVPGYVQHEADLELSTPGEVEIVDLTKRVEQVVRESGVKTGQCLLFTVSSTSAITVIEYEPGLLQDLPQALDRLFPRHGEGVEYGHEEAWHDGNGHSHIRASFIKPDLMVPVRDGRPLLGTWQQVVFVELDNKPRDRKIAVHVWGRG